MRKVMHNKAVRDLIPDIIQAAGKECGVEQVSKAQFLELLTEKLAEEVAEYQADPSLEELADIMEVLRAVAELSGYTPEDLEEARRKKAKARGGFEKRLLLRHVIEE